MLVLEVLIEMNLELKTFKVSLKSKRSLSKARYVKITLVADRTMVESYKNEDLENYLLTIMNMV